MKLVTKVEGGVVSRTGNSTVSSAHKDVIVPHKLKMQHMLPACHWPSQICPLAAAWTSCRKTARERPIKTESKGEKKEVRCLRCFFMHAHTRARAHAYGWVSPFVELLSDLAGGL